MKSSTKDNAEGKMHQVKGKVKETVGKVVHNSKLEAEGIAEKISGKVQEKVGKIEKAQGN
ncbi:MAG: CsbD family protein [Pseudomonadota bacterium]